MADETATKGVPPSLAALLWAVAGRIFQREALMFLASTVVLLLAGGGGVIWAQAKGAEVLDAGVDAKLAPIKERQAGLTKRIDGLESGQKSLAAKLEAKEERDARRFDLLYQLMLTGKPSSAAEGLSNPGPLQEKDGGQ